VVAHRQSSYKFGLVAEILVIIYLFFTFHRIIAWRYKTKMGEIDIIARRGSYIIFFEVKARHDRSVSEFVTTNQQKRICSAANIFILKNSRYSSFNFRFDLIIFNPPISFSHIKNSWESF